MLKTITTVNTTLDALLTDIEKGFANKCKQETLHNVLIQNLWDSDIYIEFWNVASVSDSALIWARDGSDIRDITFSAKEFEDINIISDWSDNDNIRIIIF